ncbi:hypothetical protein [Conexibacter woesei]|uniref:hypothetical protein n=1 Tax=Conexibacter woesei TaxID=191495 RepID=UPI0012DCC157|nr:hypothetical protein [Conexibacter woesei]
MSDEPTGRDWNALLQRVLAPFRSEAAAFNVLLGTIAIFGTIILLIVLIRLLT